MVEPEKEEVTPPPLEVIIQSKCPKLLLLRWNIPNKSITVNGDAGEYPSSHWL